MTRLMIKRMSSLTAGFILVSLPVILPAVSCGGSPADSGRTVVAVSILPQAGFVESIGGDKVEVVVMVPPGADPHTYEVKPDQMAKLSVAKMYAKVGSPVEFELAWMDKLVAANRNMLLVDCSRGVQLIEMAEEEHLREAKEETEHGHTGMDPHIWLSVKNAKIMAQNIFDGLAIVDPANKSYYEKNFSGYLAQLSKLDSDLSQDLSNVKNRNFMVFHPAFGYFARDYSLKQIAVEQGGKEPSADYLVRFIKEAKQQDIRVIFVSPQYNTSSAEVIAKEIKGRVVIIDPLAKDFIGNMYAVEKAMKEAMQ